MSASDPAIYRERLWPSAQVWLGVAVVLVMADVAVAAALGLVWGLAFTVASTLTAGYWLVSSSLVVAVTVTELRAGRAHLQLALVNDLEWLDVDSLRAAMGPQADGRTYLATRGWVSSAIRFTVADEADPTPDWIVSTRHPATLIDVIATVQGDVAAEGTAG